MGELGHTFPAENGLDSGARATARRVVGERAVAHPTDDPVSTGNTPPVIHDAAQIDNIIRAGNGVRSWPAIVQATFVHENHAIRATEQKFHLTFGLLVVLATIVFDLLLNPSIATEGAILRVLAVAPIVLLGLIAGARGWSRIMAFCVGAAPIAFVAVLVHLVPHMLAENVARYLSATALVLGLGNVILPLSIRSLIAFDSAFIITAFGTLMISGGFDLVAHLDYLLLLAIVALATLPLAYRTSRLREHNFLLSLRAQAISRDLSQANRALRELSERDPLTGIPNRRYFERAFTRRIAFLSQSGDAQRLLKPGRIAVMMIDLDHFKSFNDTNGHQAGDQCLIMVGRALERIFAEVDGVVARYGGEEFVAALRESEEGQAAAIADKVRLAVETLKPTERLGGTSTVTTSVGVAISSATAGLSRDDMIEMADAALYNAKRNGRNRIEIVEVEKSVRLVR
ncbi:MAG: GGDEF domain-containing protein [Pseudomonadota bacterium]